MEITVRSFWTVVHGMGFGALYLLGCSGLLVELYRYMRPSAVAGTGEDSGERRFLNAYLLAMVVLAWGSVLTGAYVIYPWYRAALPLGTVNLAMFPQKLLLASASTSGWHSLGMEWKEHVAWFAPISITMVAYVFWRYGSELRRFRQLRTAVLSFAMASFVAAGIAGFFGAMINKYAPVQGGQTIHLMEGEKK